MLLSLALAASLQAQTSADLIHTVGSGETLTTIANAYGLTLERLLSLNGLDPEAYLQIGQKLLVNPAAEASASPTPTAAVAEASTPAPAPIIEADAPPRAPAQLDTALCVAVYQDDNQNGRRDPGEPYLKDGEIRLLDAAAAEATRYRSDGLSEPHCLRGLAPGQYQLEGVAPPGYGLTSAARLDIDLRAGGLVQVDFGAKLGLAAFALPTAPPEIAANALEPDLISEISGLFVLALAALVLVSGSALALFLRLR